jgi:hypothetical protein
MMEINWDRYPDQSGKYQRHQFAGLDLQLSTLGRRPGRLRWFLAVVASRSDAKSAKTARHPVNSPGGDADFMR